MAFFEPAIQRRLPFFPTFPVTDSSFLRSPLNRTDSDLHRYGVIHLIFPVCMGNIYTQMGCTVANGSPDYPHWAFFEALAV